MDRRTFLQTSIAAATVAASSPVWAAEGHHVDRVGLQLYTVRDLMKKDFEGTIAKVAQTGYKEVEFAGYFGKSPQDVRKILDANNLTSPSEHVAYDVVEKKWPETLEAAHALGQKFVVCPWIEVSQRKEADGWKRAADLFNRAGEASQKAGIQFAYHNHAFEFKPSPALGGTLVYFNPCPGRFPLVHVKDWSSKGPGAYDYEGATGPSSKPGHLVDPGQG